MYTKLIQGDCLQELENIADASVDLIFTDLPYGTTRNTWDCEVYSTKKASKEKGCSNWKERKRNGRK